MPQLLNHDPLLLYQLLGRLELTLGLVDLTQHRGVVVGQLELHGATGLVRPHLGVLGVQGPGFRGQGSGFRDQGPGIRVQGPGFRA